MLFFYAIQDSLSRGGDGKKKSSVTLAKGGMGGTVSEQGGFPVPENLLGGQAKQKWAEIPVAGADVFLIKAPALEAEPAAGAVS